MAFGLGTLSPDDFAAILRAAPPGAPATPQRIPFGLNPSLLGQGGDGAERAGGPSFGLGSQMPDAPQMPAAPAPRAPVPAAPLAPKAMTAAPMPPERPAEFGTPADTPAPGAVPTSGKFPDPAAPASAPAAAEPSFLDKLMGGIQKTDGLLGSIGMGLLSTPGMGQGLAAGLKNHQTASVQKAATNLAQAEFQLKQRKLQQEDLGKNLTYQSLVRKGVSAEDAQAAIAASMAGHGEALSNLLNNNFRKVPDAPSGFAANPDGSMRAIPGGPADPATKRADAQAGAEGTAAGKPAEGFSLSKGQRRYDADGKVIAEAPGEETDTFAREGKLRGEFVKGLGTFQDVHDGYGRVIAATRQREANPNGVSPASDIGLIFGYMKMLDPGSVVREGEYATAANAAGIPDRVRNAYNKAMQGEFLTPDQRQDFLGQAGELYGTARKGAEAVAGRYRNLAGQYGVDPDRTTFLPEAPQAPTVGRNRMQPGTPASPQAPTRRIYDPTTGGLR